MAKILDKEGIPPNQCRLIFTGKLANSEPEKVSLQSSTSVQSNINGLPACPSLMALGSNHVWTSSSTPVAPHPKRFSASTINKKFLEKNTTSGSPASSTSSVAKSGSLAARPLIQFASSHSRLVTAKLTANPVVTSFTTGWSRPSCIAASPAMASTPPISMSLLPAAPATLPPAASGPQPPHAEKIIDPQRRSVVGPTTSSQKECGCTKPVWGNIKPPNVAPL